MPIALNPRLAKFNLGNKKICWHLLPTLTWWRHQMETFSALLALCEGNRRSPDGFPSQRPLARSLVFSLICAWTNGWANNRYVGDMRRHCTHYDVTVMEMAQPSWWKTRSHIPHSQHRGFWCPEMQGAKALTAKVLTLFCRNVPISTPKGLTLELPRCFMIAGRPFWKYSYHQFVRNH